MRICSHPQQVRATVPSVASFPVLLTETLGYHCAANRARALHPNDLAFVQNQVHAPSASGLWTAFPRQACWHSRQNFADMEVFKILLKCLCRLEGLLDSGIVRHPLMTTGWPEGGSDGLCLRHWLLIQPEITDNVNLCWSLCCRKTVSPLLGRREPALYKALRVEIIQEDREKCGSACFRKFIF